jgi:hypothetical protein
MLIGTYLSSNDTAPTHLRTTREASQCSDDRVFSYFAVVTYLDQIVELDASAKNRVAKSASINRTIGSDFAVVLYPHSTKL